MTQRVQASTIKSYLVSLRPAILQSSPAPKDGRYVSPPAEALVIEMFQSSPAPKDGRYALMLPLLVEIDSFNPRPPRRTGATVYRRKSNGDAIVSILARPEGRALRRHRERRAGGPSFQSSPAPKDGRYDVQAAARGNYGGVSILARPEGRALPHARHASTRLTVVSILARPEGRALLRVHHMHPNLQLFQSSPAPKDGRYSTTSPEPRNIAFGSDFREPTVNSLRDAADNRRLCMQVIVKSIEYCLRDPPSQ